MRISLISAEVQELLGKLVDDLEERGITIRMLAFIAKVEHVKEDTATNMMMVGPVEPIGNTCPVCFYEHLGIMVKAGILQHAPTLDVMNTKDFN